MRKSEFLSGVRAEMPILLGVMPFGMIYGALAVGAGLPPAAAQAMSAVVFAGSAQFVATQLFATGAPAAVLLLTTLVVNLRHMLYSASVAPYLRHLPARWKALLAYLLTDEAYAVAILHYRQGDRSTSFDCGLRPFAQDTPLTSAPNVRSVCGERQAGGEDRRHWYFLGAGLALWTTWQTSTAAGIFLGSQVPPGWSLDFTLALTFIALLIPALSDRPAVGAALSAGIVALLAAGWPYKLGLFTAALAGIAVGMGLEGLARRRAGAGRTGAEAS